jgi:hypothetical protein
MGKQIILLSVLVSGCVTPTTPTQIKSTIHSPININAYRMECTINTPSCRCRSKSGGGTECR